LSAVEMDEVGGNIEPSSLMIMFTIDPSLMTCKTEANPNKTRMEKTNANLDFFTINHNCSVIFLNFYYLWRNPRLHSLDSTTIKFNSQKAR
jgi:hypothetical protein